MFGLIVMGVLLLSMVGTGSYSIMVMMEQTQNLTIAQNEKSNLKSIELSIVNSLRSIGENRELIAPLGVTVDVDLENAETYPDANNVHQHLPDFLPVNKVNSWGNAYVYCPFGENISSAEFSSFGGPSFYDKSIPLYVVDSSVSSTLWTTKSILNKVVDSYQGTPYSAGVDYSSFSFSADYLNSNNSDRVLAVVISRRGTSNSTCEDLVYDVNKSKFKTLSGKDIVVSISRETSKLYQSNNPIYFKVNEENVSNIISLNSLSDSFNSSNSSIYSIDIENINDREITDSIYFLDQFLDSSRKIKIEGKKTAKSKIYNSAPVIGPKTIYFDGVSVLLKNMDFGKGINFEFKNSTVVFDNVKTAGSLYFENSNLSILGGLNLESNENIDYLLKFNSSTLNAASSISIDVSQHYLGVNNSLIILENMSKAIIVDDVFVTDTLNSGTNSSLFYNDETSIVSVGGDDDSINLNISIGFDSHYLFENSGVLNIKNSNIYNNKDSMLKSDTAILLNPGSRFNLDNSDIGTSLSRFNVGVYELGASFISGESIVGKEINIYATKCVNGELFDELIASSSSEQTSVSNNKINNKSKWECK